MDHQKEPEELLYFNEVLYIMQGPQSVDQFQAHEVLLSPAHDSKEWMA